MLAVVDDVTREALARAVDSSIPGGRVVRDRAALTARRGAPRMTVSDNGSGLTSRAVLDRTNRTGIERHDIVPGEPQQTAVVESFNARLREECLTEAVLESIAAAPAVIETWRRDFNTARPHSAHGGLTPAEARNRAAADRLRSMEVSADRPLPTTQRTGYATQGLSE